MFEIGERVGDYEIVTELKAGGMATLFLARRSGASGFVKHVAIKVVHEHLACDPEFVSMFVDEALLSARVHHPNVVHVEELKEREGRHYLVMEYVNGCSLGQLLRQLALRKRRMTPELAVWVAAQVAGGLHAAHELKAEDGHPEGVVHRDVSPENVLFAWEGHVKLIDFGVAKARTRVQKTSGASIKGKIRYMSPEQARGQALDRRTDVYALGIVLWEMLTMQRRFRGKGDWEVLEQVRDPAPLAPRQVNPEVPAALDEAVMRALDPDREGRWASTHEFRKALTRAVPAAFSLDASSLAELLGAAMKDAIEDARLHLPSSLDLPMASGFESQALRTMTVHASQIESYLDGESSAAVAPSLTRSMLPSQGSTPAPPVVGSFKQTGEMVAMGPFPTSSAPPRAAPPPRSAPPPPPSARPPAFSGASFKQTGPMEVVPLPEFGAPSLGSFAPPPPKIPDAPGGARVAPTYGPAKAVKGGFPFALLFGIAINAAVVVGAGSMLYDLLGY